MGGGAFGLPGQLQCVPLQIRAAGTEPPKPWTVYRELNTDSMAAAGLRVSMKGRAKHYIYKLFLCQSIFVQVGNHYAFLGLGFIFVLGAHFAGRILE